MDYTLHTFFGRNLKNMLEQRNMSQKEFAEAVGVSESTVTHWCKGVKVPKMSRVDVICKVLDCNRAELFSDDIIIEKITSNSDEMAKRLAYYRLLADYEGLDVKDLEKAVEFVKKMRK